MQLIRGEEYVRAHIYNETVEGCKVKAKQNATCNGCIHAYMFPCMRM